MKQVVFTNRAINDFEKAKFWYEEQQNGLGNKFADFVFKCVQDINEHPLSYPNKYVRDMYIKKFPYLIIFI